MAPVPSSVFSSHKLAEPVSQPGLISRSLSALQHATEHAESSSLFARIFSPPSPMVHIPHSSPSSSSFSSSSLARRRVQMISIPATYNGPTPSPGIVVAIVFGTVIAFVLVLCLISYIIGGRATHLESDYSDDFESRRSRSRSHHRSRSRRRRRPEVVEVEYSRTGSSRSMSDDDVVEVFEELDSPPESPGRAYDRRSGGYRTVDPREYGGGGRSRRSVRR